MQVDLAVKNYRCFPDSHPARISIRPGYTAFVGVNNSGKSSLLKFFYEFRPLFQYFSHSRPDQFRQQRGQFGGYPTSVVDSNELFTTANDRDLEIHFCFGKSKSLADNLMSASTVILRIPRGTNQFIPDIYVDDTRLSLAESNLRQTSLHLSNERTVVELSNFFETCRTLTRTLYIGPFRNALNVGTETDYFDIQVGQSFVQSWRQYKTGNTKSNNEAAYRLTNDIRTIFDYDDLEINPSPDDRTLQLFINGKSYRLAEVGSGLTQFILVLANAAVRSPSFILIDEPELNLHPALQLDFLTTLTSYATNGVLFTTHSIGLARAAADRLYSFTKVAEGKSTVADFETTARLSEFLGELSFSGFRELGFNRVLLVEGKTDVKTVQQVLRLYRKEHEVVILPLGGSHLITPSAEAELHEVKRITDRVAAIIDSERNTSTDQLDPNRLSFVRMCHRAGIDCHVLDRRATENYLSNRAVKKIKGAKYRALEPYEKLKDVSPSWAKEENWRIAREMTREEIDHTDLGEFVRGL